MKKYARKKNLLCGSYVFLLLKLVVFSCLVVVSMSFTTADIKISKDNSVLLVSNYKLNKLVF